MSTKKSRNGNKRALHFEQPPRRVVSLVPSMTESLFDLEMGEAVVGVSEYCLHPAERLEGLPRVGGPKNPRLEEIIALKPDLVLANQEENTRQAVEAMEAAGLAVWLTFPQTVQQAMDVLWMLVGIFRSQTGAIRLQTLEVTLEWARSASEGKRRRRYFCPIWQGELGGEVRWWMTFNQHTYIHDLLRLLGGENVFAGRERRYPLAADLGLAEPQEAGERDRRYPRVTKEEILALDPEVILLPSEPYAYDASHRDEMEASLAGVTAVRERRVSLVDGSLLTWHGTRLARALHELPALLQLE